MGWLREMPPLEVARRPAALVESRAERLASALMLGLSLVQARAGSSWACWMPSCAMAMDWSLARAMS